MIRSREVRPLRRRISTDRRATGRGVTIAFIDSGFSPHPDLITPRPRIVAHHDVHTGTTCRSPPPSTEGWAWHGTMTAVVGAGNGHRSRGHFRGLAPEAEVVLVKAGVDGRVPHEAIRCGVEWVIEHRARYGIRVLNISCGGDYDAPYRRDGLATAVERAVDAGISVICAVGNEGNDPRHAILPPASAPSAIAVGGVDDGGGDEPLRAYHGSFGLTVDGFAKPELVALAAWVPAPTLPGTREAGRQRLLLRLQGASDRNLSALLARFADELPDVVAARRRGVGAARRAVRRALDVQRTLTLGYQHADGTSFAAPIVSGAVAQMYEVAPSLTPQLARRILLQTARPLPRIPAPRQGFGLVMPKEAVAAARRG